MAIAFDRQNKTESISIPGYVKKMLQRFRPQYLLPGHRPPRTPGVYIASSFSKKPQTVFIDKSEKLSPTLVTELQAIIGTLTVLRPRCRSYSTPYCERTRLTAGQCHTTNTQCGKSRAQLLRGIQQQSDRLPRMRHGPPRLRRCLISVPVSLTISRRSDILPRKPR
jgi:hypothetical protein